MKGDALDPKGLIFEAYRIDGITVAECRLEFYPITDSILLVQHFHRRHILLIKVSRYGKDMRNIPRKVCAANTKFVRKALILTNCVKHEKGPLIFPNWLNSLTEKFIERVFPNG